MTLTRDQIVSEHPLRVQDVDVPEWEGSVRIRELGALEAEQFWAGIVKDRGPKGDGTPPNFRARLLVECIVDDDGKRMLQAGDEDVLANKSSAVLQRLFDVACELSGITEAEIEEIAGNSEGEPADSSPTD